MSSAVETTATSGGTALSGSVAVAEAGEQSSAFAAIFSKFGAYPRQRIGPAEPLLIRHPMCVCVLRRHCNDRLERRVQVWAE